MVVVASVHQAPNRTDLATFWQLVAAVVALPAALAPFVKDWLATRAVRQDGASDRDRLADAVERQWTEAAESRRLLQHNPIAVRWTQPEKPHGGICGSRVCVHSVPAPTRDRTDHREAVESGGGARRSTRRVRRVGGPAVW